MTPTDTLGLHEYKTAMFAGWGRFDTSLKASDFLRETEFKVLSTEDCLRDYPGLREDITEGLLFCAEHPVS